MATFTGTEFLKVAESGNYAAVLRMIRAAPQVVQIQGQNDDTALMLAARAGHRDIVRLLLRHGSKVNHKNKYGVTALTYAVKSGGWGTVRALLNGGALVGIVPELRRMPQRLPKSIAVREALNGTVLHRAMESCIPNRLERYEVMRLLLREGDKQSGTENAGCSVEEWEATVAYVAHEAIKVASFYALAAVAMRDTRQRFRTGASQSSHTPDSNNSSNIRRVHSCLDTINSLDAIISLEIVKDMLDENPARVSLRDARGFTPLHRACVTCPIEVIRLLIDHGADVNAPVGVGIRPLHIAVARNDTRIVRLLVERGANLDAMDRMGRTALHIAVVTDASTKMIDTLLGLGARRDIHKRGKNRPCDLAGVGDKMALALRLCPTDTLRGSLTITEARLLSVRAQLLARAIKRDDSKKVEWLLNDDPALIQTPIQGGLHPLHLAAEYGSMASARALVDRKVNVNLRVGSILDLRMGIYPNEDCFGDTPLDLAAKYAHLEMVDFLLNHGADSAASNENSSLPLHNACEGSLHFSHGRTTYSVDALDARISAVVGRLLQAGSDPFAEDTMGMTPLAIATARLGDGTLTARLLKSAMSSAEAKT